MSKQFQRTRRRGWICADCGVLNDPQARICRECHVPRRVEVPQERQPLSHTRRNILIAGAVIAGGGLGAFAWKELQDWRHSQPVLSVLLDSRMAVDNADPLAWAPDETRLGITLVPEGGSNSSVASIQIWDALRGEVLRELRPIASASEMFLSWSPHGERCATGGQEGALTLWDAGSGTSLFSRAPDSPPAYTGATGQVPLLTSTPAAAMTPA